MGEMISLRKEIVDALEAVADRATSLLKTSMTALPTLKANPLADDIGRLATACKDLHLSRRKAGVGDYGALPNEAV